MTKDEMQQYREEVFPDDKPLTSEYRNEIVEPRIPDVDWENWCGADIISAHYSPVTAKD